MTYQEKHPYNDCYPIPDETRLLIVGTAPPPRFSNPNLGGIGGLDFNFFYGSEYNYMWVFLDEISYEVDKDKLFSDEMLSEKCCDRASTFLRCHKAWMHDVLQTYHRKEGRLCSPADRDIVPECFTDFRKIFNHKSISMIAFTSEKAAEWTFEALGKQNICHIDFKQTIASWKGKAPNARERYEHCLLTETVDDHEIRFDLLPTPTGRSHGGLTLSDKKNIYKKLLVLNE